MKISRALPIVQLLSSHMSVGQGYCFAQVADTHLMAEAFGEAQDEQHLFCRQQEGLGR